MKDWPKRTHWRPCVACKVVHRVPYNKKTGYYNSVCYVCRHRSVMWSFETAVLERMQHSSFIESISSNSVRPKEWFMKKQLSEFIPYMVDKLGPVLALQVYTNALNQYKAILIQQWEQSLLFDIIYPQQ